MMVWNPRKLLDAHSCIPRTNLVLRTELSSVVCRGFALTDCHFSESLGWLGSLSRERVARECQTLIAVASFPQGYCPQD
jgi:hypothetical protein